MTREDLKLSLHLTPSTTTGSDAASAIDCKSGLPCAGSVPCAADAARAKSRVAAAYGVDYLAAISPSCML